MTYLLCGALCTFLGLSNGLGGAVLLRPVLDVISPLPAASVASICALSALCASLVSAFFALNRRLPLHPDDLLILSVGAALGGILGDLAASRFYAQISENSIVFLQNALLLTITMLAYHYFHSLAKNMRPFSFDRILLFPAAITCGLTGSFLAFGAVPLSLMVFYLFFDAKDEEASFAALTISVCAMSGKVLVMLIRQRFFLPHASVLLWLLPGTIIGAILALFMHNFRISTSTQKLLKHCMFASLLNIASATLGVR